LLAIVAISPISCCRLRRRKNFRGTPGKNAIGISPRPIVRQNIEMPHDLATRPLRFGKACARHYQP
jgi:hypothetical protein